MRKKAYKLIALFVAIIGAYLYLSNTYIYYRIRTAGLLATDNRHEYLINSQSEQTMLYVSLGDSLTAGVGTDKYEESYPYLLASKLAASGQSITLENFSYPGAKSSDLIKDLLKPAIAAQPKMITLLIGTNDVHGNISSKDFEAHYRQILSSLKSETKAKIYAINLPHIGSETLILPPDSFYLNKRTEDFNKIIEKVAEEYQVQYIDIYSPTFKIFEKDGPHYASDAFHPSALGYAIWSEIIYDRIYR